MQISWLKLHIFEKYHASLLLINKLLYFIFILLFILFLMIQIGMLEVHMEGLLRLKSRVFTIVEEFSSLDIPWNRSHKIWQRKWRHICTNIFEKYHASWNRFIVYYTVLRIFIVVKFLLFCFWAMQVSWLKLKLHTFFKSIIFLYY